MTTTKLLIFDAIAEVPLGREMHDAFLQLGLKSVYADCRAFKQKKGYRFRAAFKKMLNRIEGSSDHFYHFPKLIERQFAHFVATELPTHVLVIGFIYKQLSPAFVLQLKEKYQFSIYLYDTDSCNLYPKRREFLFFIDHELPIYDEIFSFSKVTTRFFSETKKLKATFLPFGAAPLAIKAKQNPEVDALFVGSGDLRRIFLLEGIKDVVTIYGNRWQRNFPLMTDKLKSRVTDQTIWGEALHELLANSKIVININRTHFYGAGTGVNLRIFEALAAHAFVLTDYCDELADLFEIGKEIEVFRTNQELVEKVDYYLSHPEKRLEIAKNGHAKLMSSHTWYVRAVEIAKRFKSKEVFNEDINATSIN
jgi:spore maturation protein CgeB